MPILNKPGRHLASSFEIDEDLAEILDLLSAVMSDIVPSSGYLNDLSCSLRNLTAARFVVVWLALERGNETVCRRREDARTGLSLNVAGWFSGASV